MARPGLQVGAEQPAQVGEQGRRGRGVQAVAAVVHPHAVDLEGAGQPTDPVGALEHGDRVAGAGRPPGRCQAGRPGAEDDDGRVVGEHVAGDATVSGRVVDRGHEPTLPAEPASCLG